MKPDLKNPVWEMAAAAIRVWGAAAILAVSRAGARGKQDDTARDAGFAGNATFDFQTV